MDDKVFDKIEEVDLKKKMEQAQTLAVIEDLYRPYRPKRRTRATIAKEKGYIETDGKNKLNPNKEITRETALYYLYAIKTDK